MAQKQTLEEVLNGMTDDELKQFVSAQSQASAQSPTPQSDTSNQALNIPAPQEQAPSQPQQNQYLDVLSNVPKATMDAVSSMPLPAQFTQPGRYNEAFFGGVGPEMNRQMGVPEGQKGALSEFLGNPVNPLFRAPNIFNNISKDPKNFGKASISETAGALTAPFNYMIEPLVEILPVGKATVGELLKLPPNRIKDAIKGDIAPEVVDRFVRKVNFLKKYSKHLPDEVKNQKIAPNPEQASVPNMPTNEVTQQPNIVIHGEQAREPSYNQGTGETKVRGLSQSVQDKTLSNLGELPNYNVLTDQQQLSIVKPIVDSNPERAMRIAMGQEPAPYGTYKETFFSYLANKATKEGNTEVIKKLATESEVLKQATEHGRAISSLRNMDAESPVKAVDEIVQAREASLKRRNVKPENEAKINELKSKLEETQKKLEEYMSKKTEKLRPSHKEFGSKNRIFTKEILDIASIKLKAKLSGFHSGIDPTALKEVTQIGGYYFEGGLVEFQEWSATMVKEFGENIKPYLEDAWKHIRLVFESAERQKIIGKISENMKEGGDLSEVGFQIHKLAKSFVANGVKDRQALVDSVFNVLKEVIPNITKRETADAISGYGKYKMLSKEAISARLRDLKGQLQQVSKLEDLQAKKSPLKTGIERRTPSDEERRLISRVNEAKKKFNIDNPNPEKHLKSVLETTKTRILNQIKDLKTQIESKEKFVKEKYATPDTPEISKLRSQRDKLKEQFYEIFGKPGMSDEARLERALEATRKSISEYSRRIKDGDLSPMKQKGGLPKVTPELEKALELRNKLKDQYKLLKDANRVRKSPQEIRLQSLKTRLANRIGELEQRLSNRDFTIKPKNITALDPEAIVLKNKAEQTKMAYEAAKKTKGIISDAEVTKIVQLSKDVADKKALIDHKSPKGSKSRLDYGFSLVDFKRFVADLKLKSKAMTWEDFKLRPIRTTARKISDILGFDKYLVATGDFSATLLQGGKLLANHPDIWLENAGKQFVDFAKTLKGVDAERLTMADIYSRPNFLNGEYKKLGLDFDELEEAFPVHAAEKIPVIGKIFKGWENAFTGFVRKGRADIFDNWYAKLDAKGADKTGLGTLANSFMGRGVLPFGLEKISGTLNKLLFAPKNLMADIDFLLASQNKFDALSPDVKGIALKNLLVSTAATIATLGTAYAISPNSVEFDPASSDLGNIMRGNTSYGVPFMGKSLKIVTLLYRLISKNYKSSVTGKTTKLNTGKFGAKTGGDVLADFFQNRLTPTATVINDRQFRGTDFKGEKPTIAGDIKKTLEPFPLQTFQELMKDPDVVNQILGNLYAMFGGSVTSYPRKGRR